MLILDPYSREQQTPTPAMVVVQPDGDATNLVALEVRQLEQQVEQIRRQLEARESNVQQFREASAALKEFQSKMDDQSKVLADLSAALQPSAPAPPQLQLQHQLQQHQQQLQQQQLQQRAEQQLRQQQQAQQQQAQFK